MILYIVGTRPDTEENPKDSYHRRMPGNPYNNPFLNTFIHHCIFLYITVLFSVIFKSEFSFSSAVIGYGQRAYPDLYQKIGSHQLSGIK
jgi:hypothetical protein